MERACDPADDVVDTDGGYGPTRKLYSRARSNVYILAGQVFYSEK